ncbi:transporter substrate-binding domain-containing protein [uncultured Ferrimonas sp.]|uniref:transporter substrate-binding domain-containing protein n=1 Tax=uncultured Ferrimonas sp. TaxID=432640 RepID=UPI0026236FA6|nr:transporter substrate-binding domain-containing protein [uncultured Ferrimonas sp.]
MCFSCLTLLLLQPALAQESDHIPSIDPNKPTLLIGFPQKHIEPYAISDERGHIYGLLPSLMQLYAKNAGYNVVFKPYPTFSDVLTEFKKGKLDVMVGVTATIERQSYMSFSDPIIAVHRAVIGKQRYDNYKVLNGKAISAIEGFADSSFIRSYLPEAQIFPVPSNKEAINSIALGLTDAQIGDGIMLYEHYLNSPFQNDVELSVMTDLPPDTMHLGVAKSRPELLEQLNRAILVSHQDNSRDVIVKRWLNSFQQQVLQPLNGLNLTDLEKTWIARNIMVPIGVASDWQPIEFIDEQGRHRGIAADVLAEVSKITGLQFTTISHPLHSENFKAFLDDQFRVMSTLSPSPLRYRTMLFTQPFMKEPWGLIGRSDEHQYDLSFNALNRDDLIGVIRDTYGTEMAREYCVNCSLRSYNNITELLSAVNQGDIDVAVTSLILASEQLQQLYVGELKVISKINDDAFVPVSFALKKTDSVLLSILNKGLAAIPPSRYSAIEKRWLNTSFDNGFNRRQVQIWVGSIAVLALFIIGGFLFWSIMLRKEVKRRKQVESELQQRIKFERALIDAIPFPVLVRDSHGEVITSNRAASQFCEQDEQAEPLDQNQQIARQQLLLFTEDDKHIFSGGSVAAQEKQVRFNDQPHHLMYWKSPFQGRGDEIDGVVTIVNDVTDLRLAEQRAKEAEQRVQHLADNVNGAVIQHVQRHDDPNDIRFTFVSAGIKELVGLSVEHLLNDSRAFMHVVREDMRADVVNAMRNATESGLFSNQVCLMVNGKSKWVQVQSRVVRQQQHFVWNSVMTDITEIKQQQQELEQARQNAVAATKAKSRFLANMSHEIRTPISGIISLLEIANQYPMQDEVAKIQTSLTRSANNLLHIVNDILDFSKIEASKLTLNPEPTEMQSMLARITQVQASHAHIKGLKFHYWFAPQIAHKLVCDELRLGQVLNNLINNAIKFTENGRISLEVDLMSQTPQQQTLCFTVTDTGMGINAESMATLFKPFAQADESTSRKFGGTGLGLTISKQLVEQMGGEITVNSIPKEGTSFQITVPLALDTPTQSHNLSSCRVLMVGEPPQQAEMRQYLLNWHAQVQWSQIDNRQQLVHQCREHDRNQVVISRKQYEQLELNNGWLQQQLPQLRCVVIEHIGMLSPEPLDGYWLISANPLQPEQLLHAISEPAVRVQTKSLKLELQPTPQQDRQGAIDDGRLILVAEDHPINRQVIMTQLQQLGYHADVVEDGVEALAALQQQSYGLLLTDCHMPNMDGYALTKAIRLKEHTQDNHHLPIVALTANAIQGEDIKCIEAGMDAYLCKPVSMVLLQQTMDSWLPNIQSSVISEIQEDHLLGIDPDSLNAIEEMNFDLFVDDEEELLDAIEFAEPSADLAPEATDAMVFDMEQARRIFGDDTTLAAVIKEFLQCQNDDMLLLQQAIDANQHSGVKEVGHRMKGAAKMLGCDALVPPLQQLEQQSQQQHQYAQPHQQLQQLMTQLNHQLQSA